MAQNEESPAAFHGARFEGPRTVIDGGGVVREIQRQRQEHFMRFGQLPQFVLMSPEIYLALIDELSGLHIIQERLVLAPVRVLNLVIVVTKRVREFYGAGPELLVRGGAKFEALRS